MLKEESSVNVSNSYVKMDASRVWIGIGAALGALGVIAGALGVHALRSDLDAGALNTFQTAVRFQMYHALALLGVGILGILWKSRAVNFAGALLTLGVVIFCGSLYALALTGIGILGAIAPIGGLSLIVGWAALILAAIRRPRTSGG